MGIRVTCSNGHVLNIKSELAGRVGRCPKCDVRIQIPNLDEAEMIPPKIATTDSDSTSQSIAMTAVVEKPTPASLVDNTALKENFRLLEKTHTDPQQETEKKEDGSPLSDPSAVWYIQVPDGPQFGPVTGMVLQTWIKEKRVAPDMLVWKEGWVHWIAALEAFPELTQLFPNMFSGLQTHDVPGKGVEVSLSPHLRQKIEKKKKMSRNHLFFLLLLGAIIVLGVILVMLLRS